MKGFGKNRITETNYRKLKLKNWKGLRQAFVLAVKKWLGTQTPRITVPASTPVNTQTTA